MWEDGRIGWEGVREREKLDGNKGGEEGRK